MGDVCPWFTGPALLTVLENMKPPARLLEMDFRLPIADKYRDMGTIVMGKLESGVVGLGDQLVGELVAHQQLLGLGRGDRV